jgi:hypothetical protein
MREGRVRRRGNCDATFSLRTTEDTTVTLERGCYLRSAEFFDEDAGFDDIMLEFLSETDYPSP